MEEVGREWAGKVCCQEHVGEVAELLGQMVGLHVWTEGEAHESLGGLSCCCCLGWVVREGCQQWVGQNLGRWAAVEAQ